MPIFTCVRVASRGGGGPTGGGDRGRSVEGRVRRDGLLVDGPVVVVGIVMGV